MGRVEESVRSVRGGASVGRDARNSNTRNQFQCYAGVYHPRTLRVSGTCKGKPMMILIDGGSTHNFIKSTFAAGLNLKVIEIPTFQVVVGSESSPECNIKYTEVPIQIQGHKFLAEFFELEMNGTDMVLGVQWLATLGILL